MVLEIPLPESFGPGCFFWSFRYSLALVNGNVHREKHASTTTMMILALLCCLDDLLKSTLSSLTMASDACCRREVELRAIVLSHPGAYHDICPARRRKLTTAELSILECTYMSSSKRGAQNTRECQTEPAPRQDGRDESDGKEEDDCLLPSRPWHWRCREVGRRCRCGTAEQGPQGRHLHEPL